MGKRNFEQTDDDDDTPVDEPIDVDDCVVHNITGTAWGATPQAATTAAQANAAQVLKALTVNCNNPKCPTPKKDKWMGKPRPNVLVIPITTIFGPKITVPITISLGFVCDYEITYQCVP